MPKPEQEYNQQGKPLSMKASAIRSRQRRKEEGEAARQKAGGGSDDPPENGGEPGASTGSIGVETPEKPKAQAYHCSNCEGDVSMDMSQCPTCEINLNWPE